MIGFGILTVTGSTANLTHQNDCQNSCNESANSEDRKLSLSEARIVETIFAVNLGDIRFLLACHRKHGRLKQGQVLLLDPDGVVEGGRVVGESTDLLVQSHNLYQS